MITTAELRWGEREFGTARLGDERRRRRLVAIAAGLAARPAGKITEVFSTSAEREACFRFMENDGIATVEVARAAYRHTASGCFATPRVVVPIDATGLSLRDPVGARRLGAIGNLRSGGRGMQVMTALAVLCDGTPVGPCGQARWVRRVTRRPKLSRRARERLPVEDKETGYWIEVMAQARAVFAKEAPGTRLWFQLDRGADAWPVLLEAAQGAADVTVRAAQDRVLEGTIAGQRTRLWDSLSRQEPSASYVVQVPTGPGRAARQAVMQLQHTAVTLGLSQRRGTIPSTVSLWAVRAIECATTPRGERPLEWLLLTTVAVQGGADAQQVLYAYTLRWRTEEFHKILKSGACRVEETQLGDREHIERWVVLHTSVALRLLRLTYLARHQGDLPASVELTPAEIRATVELRAPRGVRKTDRLAIGQVVTWIAELGGYTGKSSGGPPGAIVIARGLREVRPVAHLIERRSRRKEKM
jgi:hypothetical protein